MRQDIKTKFPISIKHIDHILDAVYERYPYISRSKIASIVVAFFETMRDVLITYKSISISNFVSKMRLISFNRNNSKVVKAQVKTPRKIKND